MQSFASVRRAWVLKDVCPLRVQTFNSRPGVGTVSSHIVGATLNACHPGGRERDPTVTSPIQFPAPRCLSPPVYMAADLEPGVSPASTMFLQRWWSRNAAMLRPSRSTLPFDNDFLRRSSYLVCKVSLSPLNHQHVAEILDIPARECSAVTATMGNEVFVYERSEHSVATGVLHVNDRLQREGFVERQSAEAHVILLQRWENIRYRDCQTNPETAVRLARPLARLVPGGTQQRTQGHATLKTQVRPRKYPSTTPNRGCVPHPHQRLSIYSSKSQTNDH